MSDYLHEHNPGWKQKCHRVFSFSNHENSAFQVLFMLHEINVLYNVMFIAIGKHDVVCWKLLKLIPFTKPWEAKTIVNEFAADIEGASRIKTDSIEHLKVNFGIRDPSRLAADISRVRQTTPHQVDA